MVWWYNYFTNYTKAQQTKNFFVHRSTLLPLRLYLTAGVQPIQQGLSQAQVWRCFFLRKESSAVHSVDKLAFCYCCIYTCIYIHSWRQNSCNALLLAWVQEFLPRHYPKISTCQMRFLSDHQSHWWWLRQRMIIDKPAGASMLLLMLRPCLRYVLLWKASTPHPVIERKSRIQQSKSGQTSRTAGHWHRYRRYRHSLYQSH